MPSNSPVGGQLNSGGSVVGSSVIGADVVGGSSSHTASAAGLQMRSFLSNSKPSAQDSTIEDPKMHL